MGLLQDVLGLVWWLLWPQREGWSGAHWVWVYMGMAMSFFMGGRWSHLCDAQHCQLQKEAVSEATALLCEGTGTQWHTEALQ